MTLVQGELKLVTDAPDEVSQVWIQAPKERLHGTGMITDGRASEQVKNGVVSFNALPGVAVMVLLVNGIPSLTKKLLVPDKANATLRECIEAVGLADDGTLSELEELALEVARVAAQIASADRLESWASETASAAAQAQLSKDEANNAANRAGGHQSNAEQAESNAKQAEENAKQHEIQAGSYKNATVALAQNASNAAASAADDVREELKVSIQDTVASAAAAKTSETNAALHEEGAKDAAERAEFAATETIQQVEGDFATRNYVDSAAWSKKPLSSGDNINNLSSGIYPVPSGTVATDLGLPEANAGTLHHYELDPSRLYRRQYFRADPTTESATEYRRTYYNGTWREWSITGAIPHRRGKVGESQAPDTMTGANFEGLWNYDSAQARAWGLPSLAAGFLDISVSGFSTLQEMTTLTTPILSYRRRWYNGNWSGDWERIGGGTTQPPAASSADEYAISTSKSAVNLLMPSVVDPTLSYADDHAALMDDLKLREGTVVPKGKAAVALVADHGTTVFKEWMWAEAKARDIPFTMALAPEIHLDGKGDSRHAASNEDIKQWIAEGLVIASHSGDHGGASGYFDVSRQIQTSKMKLEEKLETQVDCWVQPGYSLALGSYDDFGTGQSASRYTDYYAGRMLQQNYSVVTGYAGDDFVYPGDADLPVGVRRSLTERKDNQASVLATIEQAIATGGKHINFCHPYALVESSNTYVTKSEYIEYLDWLAAKRDAGDLVLLTLPQLAVARNTPPVVFEYGTEWSITSEPVPDWTVWAVGRVYPPAGHYYIENEGGARAEVRPSGTGNSIVSGSVVFVEQGEHILGMYGKEGHKIMIYPL